jgi:hypothetical protein
MITATEPALLAQHGLVPADSASIQLVTDAADCSSAVAAYVREKPGTIDWPAMQEAYVFRVGTDRFVVFDIRGKRLGKSDIMVFDSGWALRGWMVG